MEENFTPVNDGQAGAESPQEPVKQIDAAPATGTENEGVTPAPAEQEPKPKQTPEQNREYRERRIKAEREAEEARQAAQRERDELVATIFGGQFKTYTEWKAAYDAEQMRQQAESKGMSEDDYRALLETQRKAEEATREAQSAKQRLAAYERREELAKVASGMESHPKYGAFFKANSAEIMKYAGEMEPDGITADEQLELAVKYVIADKYEPPKPIDEAAMKEKHIKEYLESLKQQNTPVEPRGGGVPTNPPVSTGNTFRDAELKARQRLAGNKE